MYAEPITPVVRRALAHGYDVLDVEVKIDVRDYDLPISPRPLDTQSPNTNTVVRLRVCLSNTVILKLY